MRHKLFATSTAMMIIAVVVAQVPQGMNYQATVRNNQGNIVSNQTIGIKVNIRQGSGSGTIVYAETQTPTSDQFGGIDLVIGQGNAVAGNFSTINWANGTYFNEVLMDVTGGTNYVSMGVSQLMSVPFALYAKGGGTNSYTVKFNGVPISDSTINDVCTGGFSGNFGFLTENSYWYFLAKGTNTSTSIGIRARTTDTVSNSVLYYEINQGDPDGYALGYVAPVTTNVVNAIYYVPFTAIPITVPNLYYYNQTTHHYISDNNGYQVLQLLPNNPSVTGYNLTFPVNVTIER